MNTQHISPELLQPKVWQKSPQQQATIPAHCSTHYTVWAENGQFVSNDYHKTVSLEGKLTGIEEGILKKFGKPSWIMTISDNNNTIIAIEVDQISFPALTLINALSGMVNRNEDVTMNMKYKVQKAAIHNINTAAILLFSDNDNQIQGECNDSTIIDLFTPCNKNQRLNFLHNAVQAIIKHL